MVSPDAPFLRACRGEPHDRVPVWFMRQAGRSLPEYRAIRGPGSIVQAIRTPDLATEITLQPVRRYGTDAAILYSDIVTPVEAIGFGVDVEPGVGPVVAEPFRSAADLARLLPAAEAARVMAARYRPAMLLQMAGEWLRDQRPQGRVDAAVVPALERPLDQIGAAVGGCERLASTPIPFTYSVIIHRPIYLYCLLLPFGLVDSIGPMTPVIVTLVAYPFFALEALGHEIEEPFGDAPNDLALDAI